MSAPSSVPSLLFAIASAAAVSLPCAFAQEESASPPLADTAAIDQRFDRLDDLLEASEGIVWTVPEEVSPSVDGRDRGHVEVENRTSQAVTQLKFLVEDSPVEARFDPALEPGESGEVALGRDGIALGEIELLVVRGKDGEVQYSKVEFDSLSAEILERGRAEPELLAHIRSRLGKMAAAPSSPQPAEDSAGPATGWVLPSSSEQERSKVGEAIPQREEPMVSVVGDDPGGAVLDELEIPPAPMPTDGPAEAVEIPQAPAALVSAPKPPPMSPPPVRVESPPVEDLKVPAATLAEPSRPPAATAVVTAPSEREPGLRIPTALPVEELRGSSTELLGVIRRYVASGENDNPAASQAFYDFPIPYYYGKLNVDRGAQLADRAAHIRRWPERDYSILEMSDPQPTAGGGYRVSLLLGYAVTDAERTARGRVRSTIDLRPRDGRWLIYSVFEG